MYRGEMVLVFEVAEPSHVSATTEKKRKRRRSSADRCVSRASSHSTLRFFCFDCSFLHGLRTLFTSSPCCGRAGLSFLLGFFFSPLICPLHRSFLPRCRRPRPAAVGGSGGFRSGSVCQESAFLNFWLYALRSSVLYGCALNSTLQLRRRGGQTNMNVGEEIERLKEEIVRLGKPNPDGSVTVKFGTLFNDDRCANLFEALVGTLRAAKKRKLIKFDGELLLQGVHDNVDVILLKA